MIRTESLLDTKVDRTRYTKRLSKIDLRETE